MYSVLEISFIMIYIIILSFIVTEAIVREISFGETIFFILLLSSLLLYWYRVYGVVNDALYFAMIGNALAVLILAIVIIFMVLVGFLFTIIAIMVVIAVIGNS